MVIPVEFCASYINNAENYVTYEFEAKQDVMITDIRFAAFLETKDIQYSINHGVTQNAIFPISVEKGEKIDFSFAIESDETDNQSLIETVLYFDFVTNEDSVAHYNSFNLFFDPIFPLVNDEMKTVDQVIDRLCPQQ